MSVTFAPSTENVYRVAEQLIEATKNHDEEKLTQLFHENVVVQYVLDPKHGSERTVVKIDNHKESDREDGSIWVGQFKANKILWMSVVWAVDDYATIIFGYENKENILISGINEIRLDEQGKISEFDCFETEVDHLRFT